MANTFITNTSKFRPFSFQEMLQPYQMYTEAYNEADAQLNALYEDAATKAFNFGPNDTKEKDQYDEMMSKLKIASDALSAGDKNAFKTIRNINKEYRQTMIPMQQKIAKRAELAEEQRKLLSANPNLRFTKNYEFESLDNITANSTYNIIDLDTLYKNTAAEFSSKTSTMYRDNIDPTPIGDTGYYNVTTGYGYTPEEFVLGLQDKNSDIYKFYKNKIDAIDNRTDIDSSIKEEMKASVLRGMEASSGQFKTSQVKGQSDADLKSKMIKIADNLYELSGALYQYDEDGNLYKIGEKPKGKASSSGTSSSGNGSSSRQRIGRPSDPIEIKFNRKGEVKTTSVTEPTNVGQAKRYDEFDSNIQQEIDKYIGEDETSNYNYYINGKTLTIIPKTITIIEPESIDTELS